MKISGRNLLWSASPNWMMMMGVDSTYFRAVFEYLEEQDEQVDEENQVCPLLKESKQ
jgi:hypothetical protein